MIIFTYKTGPARGYSGIIAPTLGIKMIPKLPFLSNRGK